MKTTGTVTEIVDEINAKVKIKRSSMCGHDCASCGGCGNANSDIEIIAENAAGAEAGQQVEIESKTGLIVGLSFLTYIIPVAALIIFYCIFSGISENAGIIAAFLSFVISFAALAAINRKMKKRKKEIFKITGIC